MSSSVFDIVLYQYKTFWRNVPLLGKIAIVLLVLGYIALYVLKCYYRWISIKMYVGRFQWLALFGWYCDSLLASFYNSTEGVGISNYWVMVSTVALTLSSTLLNTIPWITLSILIIYNAVIFRNYYKFAESRGEDPSCFVVTLFPVIGPYFRAKWVASMIANYK